jgi:hypothetical protein
MSHHTTTPTTPAVHTATDATLSDKTSTASPPTTPAASPAPVSSGGDIGVCDDTSPNDAPVAYLDFETMGLPDQLLRGKLSYPSFRPGQPTFPRAHSSRPPTQHTCGILPRPPSCSCPLFSFYAATSNDGRPCPALASRVTQLACPSIPPFPTHALDHPASIQPPTHQRPPHTQPRPNHIFRKASTHTASSPRR